MNEYRGNYYPSHYKRRKRRNNNGCFVRFIAGVGAVVVIFGTAIGIFKLTHSKAEEDASEYETPGVVSVTPIPIPEEEIGPVVVVPNYQSLLPDDVRESLNQYLNQSETHTCDDLEAKGVTTTDHLRLRKGPGTEYDIITELDDDVFVEVLGVCDNDWYLVRTNSRIGFVSGDYLHVLTNQYVNSQEIEPSLHVLRGIRSNTSLNVRGSASENGEVIGSLSEGQMFVVQDHLENGWYQIQYGDRVGYVSGDYVSEVYATSLEELPLIYIREDASVSEKPYENSIGTVSHNQFVRIYGENDEYYLIEYNGSYGYVPKDKCERMTDYYAIIDLSDNNLKVYHLGEEILSTRVSNGMESHKTPTGFFSVYSKLDSTLMSGDGYTNVPIDLVEYYNDGCAIHVGDPNVLSHGCTHVNRGDMEKVYQYLNVGDRVFVQD